MHKQGHRSKRLSLVIWMVNVVPNNDACIPYLPTIPDSPELLRKSASNYGITARGKIITEIVDYGNLVTSGNNW